VGSAELRAAAYLRAQSFYRCPEDRSDFAKRAYLRLKADAQWAEMERRVGSSDAAPSNITTLIAVAPSDGGGPDLLAQLADKSTALPRPDGEPANVVVATLDLNQGPNLPAEELIGQRPAGGNAKRERAYLSNVCVLGAARRQGIAQVLIRDAAARAAVAGVTSLYVHVVADNVAARRLYEAERFQVEQEEGEDMARKLNRPRRLLLHRLLGDDVREL
jgi:ribosomal protein S18 acetylase RimI-like enzyme